MPYLGQLVLAVLFGVAGWYQARSLERKYGAPAWGMPSWLWGIITGFSLLLGAVLLWFAERGLKKQPQPSGMSLPGYAAAPAYGAVPVYGGAQAFGAAPAFGGTESYGAAPAYGAVPAYAGVQENAAVPAAFAPVSVPAQLPVAPAAPALVPEGWHPDPSGRYQHRWWDGQRWTSSVSTNGVTGTDA